VVSRAEIFDWMEIASLVGKSEANCRQISRRARQSVAARRPRFESSPQQEEHLMEGFLQASLSGDLEALLALLSEDVTLYSDGGGKTRAALRPIYLRCRQRSPVPHRNTAQRPARLRRKANTPQRKAWPRRLLRGRHSPERREPRGGRWKHQDHPARRQPREAR
jgi:hypothetical protein